MKNIAVFLLFAAWQVQRKKIIPLLLVFLGFILSTQDVYAQNTDSLNILYNIFSKASGKERIHTGRDIVQWLNKEGFGVDSLLLGNSLSEKEFEIKALDWTIRYLFRFEFFHSTLEGAKELVRLSEKASDTTSLINGYYFMGFANQNLGNMDQGLLYAQK